MGRTLSAHFGEHLGSVRNMTNNETGTHFNLPGHSIRDMEVKVLEKVFTQNRVTRETRKSLWIREFESEIKGINKKK